MQEVDCSGMESNLDECPHDGFGRHSCIAEHLEDASVICEGKHIASSIPKLGFIRCQKNNLGMEPGNETASLP